MASVRVACRQVNGVAIRLFKKGWDDGTGDGVCPTVPDGPIVRLAGPSGRNSGVTATNLLDAAPPLTKVDAAWMDAWLKQNALNPFVTMGLIYIASRDDDPPPQAPQAAAEQPSESPPQPPQPAPLTQWAASTSAPASLAGESPPPPPPPGVAGSPL